MSSPRPESDNELAGVTSLADAIRSDQPEDTRSCPHESCEGSLSVQDDDTVYCTSCHCTPAGVFCPPDPYPSRGPNTRVESWSHGSYNNSGLPRLAGGYEPVYDEDEDRRPNGVGTEYTFDLSTL